MEQQLEVPRGGWVFRGADLDHPSLENRCLDVEDNSGIPASTNCIKDHQCVFFVQIGWSYWSEETQTVFGRLFTVVLLGLYYVELLLYIEFLSTIFANQDEVRWG